MHGLTIREATLDDAASVTRVHLDTSRATYKGIVPDEVLGGVPVREKTIERGDRRLPEIGYGWEDVKSLTGESRADG